MTTRNRRMYCPGALNAFLTSGRRRTTRVVTLATTTSRKSQRPLANKVYVVQKDDEAEIWTVSEDGKPPVLLASGMSPVFSPDGRWVAYAFGENVNVLPYPSGDAIPISVGKGSAPVWGSEGKELFYLVPDFVRVSINPQGRTLRIGSEEKLFPARVAVGTNGVVEAYDRSNAVGRGYDFLRKSEKFVTPRRAVNSTNEIAFVYNWFQEFR